MAVNMLELSNGLQSTEVFYEGTFTRADVETNNGTEEGGGNWAAQFDNDDIADGYAYAQEYTSYAQLAYKRMETSDTGNLIKGRLIWIEHRVPVVSANGGTSSASLTTSRRGTFEKFIVGQKIKVKVNASSDNLAINDKLSVSTTDAGILIKDNTNGSLKCLEPSTTDGDEIIAEVIAL